MTKYSQSEFVDTDFTVKNIHDVIGYYYIDNDVTNTISLTMYTKPKWLHRQCMRVFFGIKWKGYDKKKA